MSPTRFTSRVQGLTLPSLPAPRSRRRSSLIRPKTRTGTDPCPTFPTTLPPRARTSARAPALAIRTVLRPPALMPLTSARRITARLRQRIRSRTRLPTRTRRAAAGSTRFSLPGSRTSAWSGRRFRLLYYSIPCRTSMCINQSLYCSIRFVSPPTAGTGGGKVVATP